MIYNESYNEVIKKYNSSIDGLDEKGVLENRKRYGSNEIKEVKKENLFIVFLKQFNNILVIILLIASVLSYFTGGIENTIVILIVLLFNAIISTLEFKKAFKSIESLKKYNVSSCYVKRNNKLIKISSLECVCGDIVYVSSGDVVCADMRIIKASGLETDESMLTGESKLVEKHNKIIDRVEGISDYKNILFKGTKVINGDGIGIVYKTGVNTQIGIMSSEIQKIKKIKSPLQKSIDKFSVILAILILCVCIMVFIVNLYKNVNFIDSLMFSISLAVCAIPEALTAIITIVLSIQTEKMAKENAVVKDIKAIEKLGCVNVVCSDKTGTLTENKMKLEYLYTDRYVNQITNTLFEKCLILCNNSITDTKSTDYALINYFDSNYVKKIKDSHKMLFMKPFNSSDKYMYTINEVDNKKILFIKGAFESLNKYININNNIVNELKEQSLKGFRIIVCCYKEINDENNYDLNNLNYLGLVMLTDPIKKGISKVVDEMNKFNVKVIMLTGDSLYTALYIANKCNIYSDGDMYLDSNMLNNLSDEELLKIINKVKVYARVSPSDKKRIITLLQKDKCVCMIGDGVNDASALKSAMVSVAMGSGSDVAKESSDIILLDDNLETVSGAIKRGRKVYKNLQNAILFLISGNIGGIFVVLYTTLLDLPIPFAPVHLLFINLINDSLPAIAIGIDENIKHVSEIIKPRNINEFILTEKSTVRIILEGLLIATFTLLSYHIGLKENIYVARTMAFVTITIARLLYSFVFSKRTFIFSKNNKFNKMLYFSLLFGLVVVFILLFETKLHNLFSIADLTNYLIFISVFLSLMPFIIIQIYYFIKIKHITKKKLDKR